MTIPVTGDVSGVHDPTLVRQAGTYYLYSSHGGVAIRTSTDLVHWKKIADAFATLPAWIHRADRGYGDIWAPDLSYWNGQWHMYYAVSSPGARNSAIGLATSPTLDPADTSYHWTDHGPILVSSGPPVVLPQAPGLPDWNAIDPNVVSGPDGAEWLAWGSYAGGIYVQRLRADGTLDPSVPATNIARRTANLGAIEGSYTIYRNGWWYLFASFDFCCHGTESSYNIRVGRSRSITGPYLDESGTPMLQGGGTYVLAGYGNVYGPGGEGVLQEGSTWWLVHHYYDGDNNGVPALSIRPLAWSPSGWPVAMGWNPSIPRPPLHGPG